MVTYQKRPTKMIAMKNNVLICLFVLFTFYQPANPCSPPRSKFGDQSIKEQSVLKRSNNAEIIVLGSVVEIYPADKYRRSLSILVAVHMVLKSKSRIKKYIKISGFDADAKTLKKHKLFISQPSIDCVNSIVELYGSYIFFIQENSYGDFYVDEINIQPAVTEIPCKPQLSKRVKRLIIKYRKEKNNRPQCNDFARSFSNFSRKCLKHRSFSRMLNEFKYKMLPIRKFFCSVRRSSSVIQTVVPTEPTMRDDIKSRKQETKDSDNKNEDINNESSNKPRLIMYSKNENYIIQDGSGVSTMTSQNGQLPPNRRADGQIPDWRYYYNYHYHEKTSSATNSFKSNAIFLWITFLLSLIYTWVL